MASCIVSAVATTQDRRQAFPIVGILSLLAVVPFLAWPIYSFFDVVLTGVRLHWPGILRVLRYSPWIIASALLVILPVVWLGCWVIAIWEIVKHERAESARVREALEFRVHRTEELITAPLKPINGASAVTDANSTIEEPDEDGYQLLKAEIEDNWYENRPNEVEALEKRGEYERELTKKALRVWDRLTTLWGQGVDLITSREIVRDEMCPPEEEQNRSGKPTQLLPLNR